MKKNFPYLIIVAVVTVLYLPIILTPALVLDRGNDLEEFFWPIIYFTKQQILQNHQFPLWNNLFLSGTPLLPDPQSPVFYLPNIIFLLLPIDSGFIVSFIAHTILGAVGTFILARKGLKFSSRVSTFVALLYILTPKLIGHLEAGHFGLVVSYAWLPFILFAIIKLSEKPRAAYSILLAISLSGLFFAHLPTFLVTILASVVFYIILSYKKLKSKKITFFILGYLLTFGLTAVTLLPQLEWKDYTTRTQLVEDRDIYPKWETKTEFLKSLFFPWNKVQTLDTEKLITIGLGTSVLAFIGFLYSKRRIQAILLSTFLLALLIILNNISPIKTLLTSWDPLVYLRVTTRVWFIPALILALLAGFGLEKLKQRGLPKIALLLILIFPLGELLLLDWLRVTKPIETRQNLAPTEVYEFLKQNKERFRVFCVNRCIPQKEAALYNLELVEGYSTLQQKNYYNYFIQLSQVFWDKYTLALPPFEIYNFREIQPHAPTLASYNVKYIIAPHKLKDKNLTLEREIGNYLIYRNSLAKSRTYFQNGETAEITKYSPNEIIVKTKGHINNQLILSEVWSSGWKAYLDGNREVKINETSSALRQVEIENDTQFVDFKYEPDSYNIGRFITLSTLLTIIVWATLKRSLTVN